MFKILLLTSCLIGIGSAGYVDVPLLNSTISIFGNEFQKVVIENVANFTSTAENLVNAKDINDGIEAMENLTKQFIYTYSAFNTAVNFLINVTNNITSDNYRDPGQFYIPNEGLHWNKILLEKAADALVRLITALKNINLEDVEKNLVITDNTAILPRAVVKNVYKNVARVADENKRVSIALGVLYRGIYAYNRHHKIELSFYGAYVPLNQYGRVMQILSDICDILQKYFYALIPQSIIIGGNSTNIEIDVASGQFNTVKAVSNIRDLYASTKTAMDQVLKALQST